MEEFNKPLSDEQDFFSEDFDSDKVRTKDVCSRCSGHGVFYLQKFFGGNHALEDCNCLKLLSSNEISKQQERAMQLKYPVPLYVSDSLPEVSKPQEEPKMLESFHLQDIHDVCSQCFGEGLIFVEADNGELARAENCPCTARDPNMQEKAENLWQLLAASSIPLKYQKTFFAKMDDENVLNVRDQIIKRRLTNRTCFLFGSPGTGKTFTAIWILQDLIRKQKYSGKYFTMHELQEVYRSYSDTKFQMESTFSLEGGTEKKEARYYFNATIESLKSSYIVVIDEIGQAKNNASFQDFLFGILDFRNTNNLPTIFISNHCEDKSKTLDGRMLSGFLEKRLVSRITSGFSLFFGGEDRRVEEGKRKTEEYLKENIDTVSKEEIENFSLGEASPKLMTLDDNTHHIMNWLTRNPAFETVSLQKRSELTEIVNDEVYDKDRAKASIFRDVWEQGSTLIVSGPVCDQEDMKLYALLVNELTKNHKEGLKGLTLEISLSEVLKLSNIALSGKTVSRIQRQLNRLVRMSMNFKNSKGHRWMGPLINDIKSVGDGRNCRMQISFNHFMITFYRLEEYALFQRSVAKELKGDSASFYAFYASQGWKEMKVSVEKAKKLLGIDPSYDKKEASKKIKKSVQDLIDCGVMDPEKTFVKAGVIHTARIA